MRTKTLLLTASLVAAGVASSMAQTSVYSVNAVGYVNTTVGAKYSIIANPLTAANNTIPALFTSVPNGFQVYRFTGTSFQTYTFDSDLGWDGPSVDTAQVNPGEGIFVRNPTTTPVTITFVGEVPQGDTLSVTIPQGLSIRSSQVPIAGTLDSMNFPLGNGDQVYLFNNGTQSYKTYTYDTDLGWDPSAPSVDVGQGFFVRKAAAATWTRSFHVNG